MLTGLSGPDYALSPGDTHDCNDAEAKRLIEAGFAEAEGGAPEKPKVERAVKKPPAETR